MLLISVTKSKLRTALGMSDLICGAIAEHATLEIFNDLNQFEAWLRVFTTTTPHWPALVAGCGEPLLDAAYVHNAT